MITGNKYSFANVLFMALVSLFCLFATPLNAAEVSLEDSLKSYAAKAPAILTGEFEQQKWVAGFPKPLTSQGEFVLAKDVGLLWRVQKPYESVTVMAVNDQDATNAQWRYVSKILLGIFNMQTAVIEQHFAIDHHYALPTHTLVLTPVTEQLKLAIDEIRVTWQTYPQTVLIRENNGDKTVIVFSKHRALTSLPKELAHE